MTIPPDRVKDIPDIETADYIFTDGCGLISPDLAQELARSALVVFPQPTGRYAPSIFQIRYRLTRVSSADILRIMIGFLRRAPSLAITFGRMPPIEVIDDTTDDLVDILEVYARVLPWAMEKIDGGVGGGHAGTW
ncbi:hypothetical protein QBC41DRAFT_307151 [Cercophora samala]|uniref:RNA-dependent RNA polymerase n=1 Tax=Cercophora samala TaxID=330535 RepID=A0AA39Z277_9PEZI|nr:hypothetical protein QBC41DRAFT_307151 [Cercophora samala]